MLECNVRFICATSENLNYMGDRPNQNRKSALHKYLNQDITTHIFHVIFKQCKNILLFSLIFQ